MVLFFKYSRRTLALLALVLVAEYAIVHRISLDALHRSDAGLSQWRQLLSDCNCTDRDVRHLTLIHDGLYQRAYSVHLLHRVLTISSEDGDPYEAFGETADDDEDGGDDEFKGTDGQTDDPDEPVLVPSNLEVPYSYAPGDMLSGPTPLAATFQAAGQALASPTSAPDVTTPPAVPALPAAPSPASSSSQLLVQSQSQPPQNLRSGANGGSGSAAVAAHDAPLLMQAVVWQPGKVLSLFPWQLRAHFFLSLASTRMYLLMGLWPRTAAVVAAAPRRLRQQHHHQYHHHHHHHSTPGGAGQPGGGAAGGGAHTTSPYPGPGTDPAGHHHSSGGTGSGSGSGTATSGGIGPAGSAAGGHGGYLPSHPHVQAQAAAHAYAQHAHGYDGYGGGLYGIGRSASDESQSLAAALSALGRGVPVFLPPDMLVEHGVQEDLMASCVFKPAVRHVTAGPAAPGGSDAGGAGGSAGFPLPRWRSWPSLLGRWVARLAGAIAQGGRTIASLQPPSGSPESPPAVMTPTAAAVGTGTGPLQVAAVMAESAKGGSGGGPTGREQQPAGSRIGGEAGAAGGAAGKGGAVALKVPALAAAAAATAGPQQPQSQSQQQQQAQQHAQQQPQHAYVECRLYRTDRVRNVSYTCPAVLTVLPSPPRGGVSGLSRLLQLKQRFFQTQSSQPPQPQPHHQSYAHHAAGGANGAGAGTTTCPAGGASCPGGAGANSTLGGGGGKPQPPPRLRPRLLRRLWLDLRYMTYGVVMPYKWAPILAGLLSPHLFLLACLPAVQSLGLMGPFTVRLCAYHAVCLLLTGADHLLLLRLASELWLRARRARGPAGRGWRRWLVWGRWLCVDGFFASSWGFRLVVLGILTTKQVELWKHLYGPAFRPHPLLYCTLVVPASWLTACGATSAVWRLAGGGGHQQQPASAPLLLFQEGFLSGLSSPFYSLAYISFAVLGLGGGGVGGGAGGVLGLAAAGSRLPLWLLDTLVVSPLLSVVALDVLWNMDTAARASPLLLVIVNALRANQQHHHLHHPGGGLGRGDIAAGFRQGGGGRGGLLMGGGGGAAAAAAAAGGGGSVSHSSLWMLLETARWWAMQVRDATEDNRQQLQQQQQPPIGAAGGEGNAAAVGGVGPAGGEGAAAGGPDAGAAGAGAAAAGAGLGGPREGAAGAVARVALAARHGGMAELPARAIAAMVAAFLLPLPEARWPPRQQEHHARALDLLLEAAATAGGAPGGGRAGPGGGGPGAWAGGRQRGHGVGAAEEEEDVDMGGFGAGEDEGGLGDVNGVEELLGVGLEAAGDGGEGEGGERLVRTASGGLRPLAALEAELRAGQAQVAALRAQLAAAGRGVPDLLLLGRWPPPLELPPECHGWSDAVPHGFLCPITHALMTQPALLVSPDLSEASPTYELTAIRQWLRSNRTDPTTGRYLRTYHFLHNDNLRKAIEDWVQDRLAREQQHHQQQRERELQAQQHQHQLLRLQRRLAAQRSPVRGGAAAAAAAEGSAAAARAGRQPPPQNPIAAGTYPMASPSPSPYGGPYDPVSGPGRGQRSICVGTSSGVLRMQSPERWRGGQGTAGGGAGLGRDRSRGRSLSRGRALRHAGQGAGEAGAGGTGAAAAVAARQVVQRATSRQRGLPRDMGPQ